MSNKISNKKKNTNKKNTGKKDLFKEKELVSSKISNLRKIIRLKKLFEEQNQIFKERQIKMKKTIDGLLSSLIEKGHNSEKLEKEFISFFKNIREKINQMDENQLFSFLNSIENILNNKEQIENEPIQNELESSFFNSFLKDDGQVSRDEKLILLKETISFFHFKNKISLLEEDILKLNEILKDEVKNFKNTNLEELNDILNNLQENLDNISKIEKQDIIKRQGLKRTKRLLFASIFITSFFIISSIFYYNLNFKKEKIIQKPKTEEIISHKTQEEIQKETQPQKEPIKIRETQPQKVRETQPEETKKTQEIPSLLTETEERTIIDEIQEIEDEQEMIRQKNLNKYLDQGLYGFSHDLNNFFIDFDSIIVNEEKTITGRNFVLTLLPEKKGILSVELNGILRTFEFKFEFLDDLNVYFYQELNNKTLNDKLIEILGRQDIFF